MERFVKSCSRSGGPTTKHMTGAGGGAVQEGEQVSGWTEQDRLNLGHVALGHPVRPDGSCSWCDGKPESPGFNDNLQHTTTPHPYAPTACGRCGYPLSWHGTGETK